VSRAGSCNWANFAEEQAAQLLCDSCRQQQCRAWQLFGFSMLGALETEHLLL
jgi:hypothetical protein